MVLQPGARVVIRLKSVTASLKLIAMSRIMIVCAAAALVACAARDPNYASVAADLDRARAEIMPPLGATTYTLDSQRLLDQPGDENRSLAQSLQQLPGVSLGPNGQLRVRGQ